MPSSLSFLQSCNPELLQSCGVREAGEADAIDGVQPRHVVEPPTPDAVAALLAWASRERLSTMLRGGGTKLGWGRRPRAMDLVVSTRALNRVLAHPHGDLTATVEAGTTVRELNEALALHRQWLPVDIAFDGATVGGMIATNDSGSLRQRHGTPRDLLIGIHLATTDGRVVKAGGTVVKNVAGYDLGKLVSGSNGSLAAIVSATFKLAPLPGASTTAIATFREPEAMARAVAAISASQLEPTAFDVHVAAGSQRTRPTRENAGRVLLDPPYRLLIKFATTQAAIDAQVDALRPLIAADTCELVTGAAEDEQWRRQARAIWSEPGVIVRASWLPANLAGVVALLNEIAEHGVGSVELAGRAGVGAGMIRLDGGDAACVAAVGRLRAAARVIGHVVVVRADADVKAQLDVWGPPPDHVALLTSVKRAFDPAGILNAGRGPI